MVILQKKYYRLWNQRKNAEKCEVRTGSRFGKTGKSVVLGVARIEKEDGKVTIS